MSDRFLSKPPLLRMRGLLPPRSFSEFPPSLIEPYERRHAIVVERVHRLDYRGAEYPLEHWLGSVDEVIGHG